MPFSRFWTKLLRLYRLPAQIELLQESLGRVESRLNSQRTVDPAQSLSPRDYEFKVYSQWGEDGIIDYLTSVIPIPNRSFVEFGVETYVEANTLFLLRHSLCI